jgi:hypothetical protein
MLVSLSLSRSLSLHFGLLCCRRLTLLLCTSKHQSKQINAFIQTLSAQLKKKQADAEAFRSENGIRFGEKGGVQQVAPGGGGEAKKNDGAVGTESAGASSSSSAASGTSGVLVN